MVDVRAITAPGDPHHGQVGELGFQIADVVSNKSYNHRRKSHEEDSQIQKDVIDALQYEPSVDASKIGVASKDGIVTLTGTVSSYTEKESAASVAERVSGVKAVVDETKVELLQMHERTDQDIARAALWALEWHVQVPHTRIRVKVENMQSRRLRDRLNFSGLPSRCALQRLDCTSLIEVRAGAIPYTLARS
jgi:BON domain